MDAAFRDDPTLFCGTINVRRVTGMGRSGSSETLGPAIPFAVYSEKKSRYVTGTIDQRFTAQRMTRSFYVIDHADVVAAGLVELKDSDRFWTVGADPNVLTFGVKPKRLEPFDDPETGARSHWEVEL